MLPSLAGPWPLERTEWGSWVLKPSRRHSSSKAKAGGSHVLSSPSVEFTNLRQSFCRGESLRQTFKDSGKTPSDRDSQRSGDDLAMCYNAKVISADATGAWLKEEDDSQENRSTHHLPTWAFRSALRASHGSLNEKVHFSLKYQKKKKLSEKVKFCPEVTL